MYSHKAGFFFFLSFKKTRTERPREYRLASGRKSRMNQKRKPLELYVHIPFCIRKCAYCDFVSGPGTKAMQKAYEAALTAEIDAAEEASECEVSTVFFGGGTPSVVDAGMLARIMEKLRKKYVFSKNAEITLEANPGTLDEKKLNGYRKSGFNRISIGCQSVHDDELKRLGRIHTFAEFQESFALARAAGFTNINVDLMSGLPGQSKAKWEESLRTIAKLSPEHISAYSLIVEPGTLFAEQNLDLPDEETEREMYAETEKILAEYGFSRYEISNYAKPDYTCRHNIGYWNRTDYLGFGPSAASLFENRRWTNTADVAAYVKACGAPEKIREEEETLSMQDAMEDFMFLGLRMTGGISMAEFEKQFGKEIHAVYGEVLRKYEGMKLLQEHGGYLSLTRDGISVSNVILADFLL